MARQGPSLIERTLVQVDRAFWCIHDHLDVMVPLGLPTLIALAVTALAAAGLWRTWDLPPWADYLVAAVALPQLALMIFTILSLPCAVFAWRRAGGETATARDCFAYCGQRLGRLLRVLMPLSLLWLFAILLFGVPLIVVWPRTCVAPLVALFEDQPRIFRRSRRILREDVAVYLIGGIYLGMGIVLAGLLFTPRLLVQTNLFGSRVLEGTWRQLILDYLWIFEALSAATVLTALAMSWWIALTLLYHDIRWRREGEDLRQKVMRLRGKVAS